MNRHKDELMPTEEQVKQIVKKKDGRIGQNLSSFDTLAGTGENSRYINFIMAARAMPKIDTGDPKQVMDRIDWYFGYCAENDMKPTVSGLASAIGVSRNALWKWKSGIDRPQNYPLVEEAYNRLEELWELYMMIGKIHPANGIFLGKNHFGYKDEQNVIVTPNNPLGDTVSIEEIEEKYAELPDE